MELALSGCVLQAVTENPLADPGILGINAGAGFTVMLFLTLFPALHTSTIIYQPLFAMAGGLLAAVLLYVFSKRNGKVRPAYLLLGGIGLSAGFSSVMLIMAADMENSSYQLVARWLAGNIWGTSWYQVKNNHEILYYNRQIVRRLQRCHSVPGYRSGDSRRQNNDADRLQWLRQNDDFKNHVPSDYAVGWYGLSGWAVHSQHAD